ncbi:FAD-dependent oxidoreductase [Cardinium endosymbiont of Culicoides punctatus]|uniref:FAD-dependent oxidoreductase n=1 Tax=Cardinium endosymbiont of Culicoides punctatus TaxID=2304601 RepID=UPI0010584EB2|nr:FAD-dependent oxidoreductase [Cardinium endosymbiont of Culicoides punctatus]TDG95728.1 tRNA 5-methylaminomethyl-2-thiouridine biosynthesis bifunctional protein MnmC [Cardinium endosymbiont of Culicoides punctatus]
MRIAIVGGGFAGLATSYHLLEKDRSLQIKLFEKNRIGAGASGAAAGLLHGYVGNLEQPHWKEYEGIQFAKKLLKLAAQAIGKDTYIANGVVRCIMHQKEIQTFKKICQNDPSVFWWEEKYTASRIGIAKPSIFISEGFSVYSDIYLQGLWLLCQRNGAELVSKDFGPEDYAYFDIVIFCCGAELPKLYPNLKLVLKRGEVLLCEKQLKYGIIGNGYFSLSADPNLCYIGSTSRENLEEISLEEATNLILSKTNVWFRTNTKILGYKSGIRVHRSSGILYPMIGQLDHKIWCFTALGSRGLMYHGYLGAMLARAVLHQKPELIPNELGIY